MDERIKHPRIFHFDWSPGLQNDDRRLESTAGWEGTEVVVTEKYDGENTTMSRNYIHARSVDDMEPHPSRTFIKAIHGEIAHDIPEGFRICGENMTAVHSLKYANLPSYFLVFGVWNGSLCLSWAETMEWCALLGLSMVPLIYWGEYSDDLCKQLCTSLDPETQEGLVVRPAGAFNLAEFSRIVGKYVRRGHVATDQHWMRKPVEYNGLQMGRSFERPKGGIK
jgi:hypothetical protein